MQELWPEGVYGGDVKEWRPVNIIFVLSPSLAPAHWYLPERSLYPSMVLRFLWLHQGTLLQCLALVTSGAYVHRFHRTVTHEENVFKQPPPPRTQQEATGPGAQSFQEEVY